MAKDKPTAPPPPKPVGPDIHIVGLVKAGKLRYSLVTGTLANPIIDPTPDPLEHTRQRMEMEIRKLVQTIP